MEYLPEELVEEIASYLNFEDVVACSNVSLNWEHAFNANRIWKRFLTIEENYFEKQTSKMNYSNSTLCQLEPCQSKALAMKQLFITNNFTKGKFYTEEINVGAVYVDCVKETVDETGNHWLFMSLSDGHTLISEHTIKVWNVNHRPLLQTSAVTPLGEKSRPMDSRMKMIGDRLFHINQNLVLIYKFAHPQYELKFLYKIEIAMSGFPSPVFISHKMICLPDTIVGFAFTNFHIHHRLHPSYEVWSHDGTSVSNNFDGLIFLQNVGFTSFPNLLVKKKDQNTLLVVYEYYSANRHNFALKVFDCSTLDYTDVTVEKRGKLKNFYVLGNIVILFYTVRDQNSSVEQTYIESFGVENGSSLFCSHLESETINRGGSLKFYHGPGLKKVQFMNGDDLIAIGNKVMSVYRLTDTGLIHVSSFELTKRDGVAMALQNNYVIMSYSGQNAYYEMLNYKSGEKMYQINLPRQSLTFSFNKKSFPMKIIACADQNTEYAKRVSENSVFIIRFW